MRGQASRRHVDALVRLALAACLAFGSSGALLVPAPAEASSVPAYNAKLTQKNMLRLVRAYDDDAYHILSAQDKAGDKFSSWMKGEKRLADAADTTVHEEFHLFAIMRGGYVLQGNSILSYDLYYLGAGKTRKVVKTKVFKTSKAASKIPERYRTFRYDTYVSKKSTAAANGEGVYGLLNEFSAYYWGMHVRESLYPYVKKHVSSARGYEKFASDFMNDRDAYAEFYYWTLVYLDYARVHKPKVYKQILANKSYVKTFNTMRSRYGRLIRSYRKDLDAVCREFNGGKSFAQSYDEKTGALVLSSETLIWPGRPYAYDRLSKQLASSKYKKVRKALANAG